jgi:hypothetical protein
MIAEKIIFSAVDEGVKVTVPSLDTLRVVPVTTPTKLVWSTLFRLIHSIE